MNRSSKHILRFATEEKRSKLGSFFVEYSRVVNKFIDIYWTQDSIPTKFNSSHYKQVDSWLMGKSMKCAGSTASSIIRSTREKQKNKIYSDYKKIYSKAKKKGKKWTLVTQKWSDWSKGKKFRSRINKPIFSGNEIELNSDLIRVQDAKNTKSFDMWLRIGSVFGNRFSLLLPTKKHEHFNSYISRGFEIASSVKLWKSNKGHYYAILILKKEDEPIKTGKVVGIDIGVNKLITTSDNEFIGTEIKQKISKLNGRKKNSKNWNQTREEIKEYIGWSVNQMKWDDISDLVMEDLNVKSMMKIKDDGKDKWKGKNKRKMLGHWNVGLLERRIKDKCENNRVNLHLKPPAFTSQTCSKCGVIHAESRDKEKYECISCGNIIDADYNASLNIKNLLLDGEDTVPHGQKRENYQLVDFGSIS